MHYQNYGPLATDTCVGLCWKKKSEVTLEQVAVKTQFEQKKKAIVCSTAFCIPMKLFNCWDIEPFEIQYVKIPLQKMTVL